MTTPTTQPLSDGDPTMRGIERVVQLVSAVVAPITLFTALLYYFGWMRTNSLFQQFGVEASVLHLSAQDYLLRSVEGLYVPVGVLLVACLLGLWGHGLVAGLVATGRATSELHHLALDTAFTGLVLFVTGVGGIVAPGWFDAYFLLAPCCLAAGTVLCAWSRWLWQRLPGVDPTGPRAAATTSGAAWSGVAATVLVVLVVVLSLFWAASDYAAAVGRGLAATIMQDLDRRPSVVVYSAQRLFLAGPGLQEQLLPADPTAAYHFRYEGLRLLIESDGRFVLLPARWTRDSGPAYVLDRTDAVRVEFRPGQLG